MPAYPVSAQYAPLSGIACMKFGVAKKAKAEPRTTKPCKKCGAELPFDAYRWVNNGPVSSKRKRSPRCPQCEAGSTRIKKDPK